MNPATRPCKLFDSAVVKKVSEDSPSSSEHSAARGSQARPNRDPQSHRIIEKRRRDRMNNCLTNLSKLIPQAFLKKGRGRIEKTEIIEMGIRYLKVLQEERKALAPGLQSRKVLGVRDAAVGPDDPIKANRSRQEERYRQGYQDCMRETLRFLDAQPYGQETKGRLVGHLEESLCSSLGRVDSEPIEGEDEPLNMSLKRGTRGPEEETKAGGTGSGGGWSCQYPSSPASSRSFSDVSSGGSFPESPPRVLSPPSGSEERQSSSRVPVFALHSSGLCYVPLSLGMSSLGESALSQLGPAPPACHPVTISVAFPQQVAGPVAASAGTLRPPPARPIPIHAAH